MQQLRAGAELGRDEALADLRHLFREQGTGELGFFSPYSWWPLYVALAAATAAVGFAIGWWLFLIGAMLMILAAIGFVFEYYRGHFSH